jgi:pyrimidine-nucleoside phosphorylase
MHMRAVDIIIKKRDHQKLSQAEIEFFVSGYAAGDIPDYQAAAWAMAVLLNGMDAEETTHLIMAMAHSGEIIDLSQVVPMAVDKHSTGGVGDKTTLVVEPVVAACGLPVGKMSGRGLGFTGGTLDKMESIPGFRTSLEIDEFMAQLKDVGLVLAGQSKDLAPADGMLYALRDVTGTVQSIPLIASSIMSKKIAAGAQAIVLDVKTGLGAFMQTMGDARQLAELMVTVAGLAGRRAVALISDMNQPLGEAVGNALEVKEAIATLQGSGPEDFLEHCLVVAAHMLHLGGQATNPGHGRQLAEEALGEGRAWEKFRQLVQAQGGDVASVDDPSRLPSAAVVEPLLAPHSGWIARVHARQVGEAAVLLGAGRARKEDPIDHGVGILVHTKVGNQVEAGQPLFTVHAASQEKLDETARALLEAVAFADQPVQPLPLFYGEVTEADLA